MAEKCLTTFGTSDTLTKSTATTINCHGLVTVDSSSNRLRSTMKIMDNESVVEIGLNQNDNTTRLINNGNLIDNCNVLNNSSCNKSGVHLIKPNNNSKNNDEDDDDIDDDGCGSGSSDEIPPCNNINEEIENALTTRNDLNLDNNIIYLETPVIDENNVCLVSGNNDFEKVQAKPKRLSDEFLSSDDGGDIDDDDITNISLPTKLTIKPETPATAPTSIIDDDLINGNHTTNNNNNNNGLLEEDNSNEQFMPVSSSSHDFLEDETNSSCSNLLNCNNKDDLLMDEEETDEPSTSSSTTSSVTDCFIKSKKQQFQVTSNPIDVNGATSSESTVSYYDNDVQSMDAIERRDFEHEQRLTGGILLRARSLVSCDNKLNLDLIKTYHNNDGERIISSDSKFLTTQREQQHTTTPTSSRNCTTRLTKSTAKINLSATLDCIKDNVHENKEKKIMKLINLQASTSKCQQKSVISSTVTSATPSSSCSTTTSSSSIIAGRLDTGNNKSNKYELFSNSNSNDSLSSDKSYSTSSNHSLPNISNKSASCSSNGVNNCTVTTSTITSNTKTSNIHVDNESKNELATNNNNNNKSENNDVDCVGAASSTKVNVIQHNNDIVKGKLFNEICASTSKEYLTEKNGKDDDDEQSHKTDKCSNNHVEDIAISMNLSKTIQTTQKSVRFNKTIIDIKDSCNYNSVFKSSSVQGAAASTSANVFVGAAAAAVAASSDSVAVATSQDDNVQNIENPNFNENPLLDEGNNVISEPLQLHHHDADFDDETWADCEEGSDEEICTCHNSNNPTIDFLNNTNTEDDLPSKDVDLSSYIQMVSISEDIFLQHNVSPDYPVMQRKRKLNDSFTSTTSVSVRTNDNDNNLFMETPSSSSRKRLALDYATTPRSSQSGSSLCGFGSPSTNSQLIRTPRSVIPTKDNPPPELQNWLGQFQLWSHAERLLAVDRLIEHCEPQQVRHMMKVIEPQFQRDFISLLPRELALQVLSYLDPKDLLRAAQTCRSWRFLCDDNLLWKEKCKTAQILTESATDQPKRGRAGNMPPISSPWKAAYMRQHIIEMNWRTRPIREPKILKGHDDHVITCLQFYGNRIVSGSDDNTLKVWSAVSGKCLRTLVGHTGGVWSSQMAGNVIISGSTDRTLKVWDMETGQCIHTLLGHTSTVRCMHLHGKKVVSGSRDATLRVWDIGQGSCLHVLVGHLAAVRCVQYDGKLIVSGAYDYMVKIWHPERQECLHTLQGHTNRVYSLQFDGIHVVSGSLDTSIRVWDAETGNSKHTLMGHQSLTSGMELRSNILVSGNADSTVKVWDITTGQCLQTLSGPHKHQSAVTCLQFNSRFVVTSSDDGTVKLWDVKTGDFIRNLVALGSGGSGGVVWRIRANDTKLICAVGSRNGTEETKLMVLDFDVEGACVKCS